MGLVKSASEMHMKAWLAPLLLSALLYLGSAMPAAAPAQDLGRVASLAGVSAEAGEVDRSGFVKGFYISYAALGNSGFLDHVQDLLADTELNAAVMDFKGDRGLLTFPSQAPLARAIGADQAAITQDPHAFMRPFKARNVRTIARIVVFKDDVLTDAHPEWAVIDASTGGVWHDHEGQGWADPGRSEVWDYNVALAIEAAQMGFDEVQFDYVRFPTDGNVGSAIFSVANTAESRVAAITGLLGRAKAALQAYGVALSVDLFGYTPWVAGDMGIGQQIEALAPYVDVIAPMIYPSTFDAGLPGEAQKYRDAIAYPYDIVYKSTQRAVSRARAVNPAIEVRPWLQDFQDYTFDQRTYTPQEIRQQIDAAREAGARGWMLWDPAVRCTRGALVSAQPSLTPDPDGSVPVLSYRDFALPGESPLPGAVTLDQFRRSLEELLAAGFYPVNLKDLAQNQLRSVPAGKRPIALTFADSTPSQLRLLPNGAVDPNCAVGVLLAFSAEHPADWPPRATFFVQQGDGQPGADLFGTEDLAIAKLQLLVAAGMEIGVRPLSKDALAHMTEEEAQRALGRPSAQIEQWLPGYDVVSLMLPAGDSPRNPALLRQGIADGEAYAYGAAVLPDKAFAPSPHRATFDPYRIPLWTAGAGSLLTWLTEMAPRGGYYVSSGE